MMISDKKIVIFIFFVITFIFLPETTLAPYNDCSSNQYCCLACKEDTGYDAGTCAWSPPSSDSVSYKSLTGVACNDVHDPDCCGAFPPNCYCCHDHGCSYTGQKFCYYTGYTPVAWGVCGQFDGDRCFDVEAHQCDTDTEYCDPNNPGCYPKKGNGGSCQHDYECLSGNCQNGVCCQAGKTCCTVDSQCPGSVQCYCQGSTIYRTRPVCTNTYTCDTVTEQIATCSGSSYICSGSWRVRRDYYCQSGACSCQYTETNVENCDAKDACSGDNYLDFYCSRGSCVYNTEKPDDSQRACETCAGGKWLGESAPQKCCNDNDNFCYGNGVCTNGNFYDSHCGDGVCNCGETMSTCFNDCCKQDGQMCNGNNECCSGNCIADYEGNRYCCQATQCAYNGTCYNNGQRLGNYTCYNGKWKRPPTTTISPNLNISWTADDVGLGVYTSSLIWSFDPLIPQEQWSNANSICNISDKNAVCSNLINEKTYYFRCKVRDNAGNINASDYIAVTIDAIPPRTNFYSFENLTDQFILMWTAQDNIGINYFDIQVERNGSWENITTVCYNINVSCQNKICIGYANCSVSVGTLSIKKVLLRFTVSGTLRLSTLK